MKLLLNPRQTTTEKAKEDIKRYLIEERKALGYTYSGVNYVCKVRGFPVGTIHSYENRVTDTTISTIFDICELYQIMFRLIDKSGNVVFQWPQNQGLILFYSTTQKQILGEAIGAGRGNRSRAWLSRVVAMDTHSLGLIEKGAVGVKVMNLLRIMEALEWTLEMVTINNQ